MTESLTKWRESYEKKYATCRAIEAIGVRLGLPEGFEVRDWPGLDWVQHGHDKPDNEETSLPQFRRMVEATAAVLGPPDDVGAQHWLGAYGDNPPDLVAKWRVTDGIEKTESFPYRHVEVTVRLLSPKGCQIKPGTEYREAQTPELHPACTHALKELEELGGV